MFLALLDLGERRFDAGENVGPFSCGVQRARGKREIDGERVAFLSRVLLDIRVQLHQVRSIPLEQLVQLRRLPMRFFFDGLAPFFMSVANRSVSWENLSGKNWKGLRFAARSASAWANSE